MQISMTFRHMDATDAMKELITEKVNKVKKYLQGPIEANVVLPGCSLAPTTRVRLIRTAISTWLCSAPLL